VQASIAANKPAGNFGGGAVPQALIVYGRNPPAKDPVEPADYESGGQEFESLRARQQDIDNK
jgi:hypothetical protein